tara:strand:- start:212 stop:586 length:375 start_codon:yes stop_codon:yes gene_type:complete
MKYIIIILVLGLTLSCYSQNKTIELTGRISVIDTMSNIRVNSSYKYLALIIVDSCNCKNDFLVVRADTLPTNYWKGKNFKIEVTDVERAEISPQVLQKVEDCPPIHKNKLNESYNRFFNLKEFE